VRQEVIPYRILLIPGPRRGNRKRGKSSRQELGGQWLPH